MWNSILSVFDHCLFIYVTVDKSSPWEHLLVNNQIMGNNYTFNSSRSDCLFRQHIYCCCIHVIFFCVSYEFAAAAVLTEFQLAFVNPLVIKKGDDGL